MQFANVTICLKSTNSIHRAHTFDAREEYNTPVERECAR